MRLGSYEFPDTIKLQFHPFSEKDFFVSYDQDAEPEYYAVFDRHRIIYGSTGILEIENKKYASVYYRGYDDVVYILKDGVDMVCELPCDGKMTIEAEIEELEDKLCSLKKSQQKQNGGRS